MPGTPSSPVGRIVVAAGLLVLLAGAGVLVPGVRNAKERALALAVATDLAALDRAVAAYRLDHGGALPGVEGGIVRVELLVRQLTLPTDATGAVTADGEHGPYLRAGIPPNPRDGCSDVHVINAGAAALADGSGGWLFHAQSGRFLANTRAHP